MKLFVDHNLPPALARGLHELVKPEHLVVALIDKFGGRHGIADAEWIEALAIEGGWTVLSGDRNIARKKPSRALFLRARLVGFFPVPSVMDLPLTRKAARVLTVWDAMVKTGETVSTGTYELSLRGDKFAQIGS